MGAFESHRGQAESRKVPSAVLEEVGRKGKWLALHELVDWLALCMKPENMMLDRNGNTLLDGRCRFDCDSDLQCFVQELNTR